MAIPRIERLHGAIAPSVIGRASLDLDDSGAHDLRIAVWHHGLTVWRRFYGKDASGKDVVIDIQFRL